MYNIDAARAFIADRQSRFQADAAQTAAVRAAVRGSRTQRQQAHQRRFSPRRSAARAPAGAG